MKIRCTFKNYGHCQLQKHVETQTVNLGFWIANSKNTSLKERLLYIFTHRYKQKLPSTDYMEIEENNRMGKTRDLFKKMRDTKG